MYEIKTVEQTALAKKLGGVPVFHDGVLKCIHIDRDIAILDIEILSENNPRLQKNTVVKLKLHEIKSFDFSATDDGNGLFIIHDLDIRKETDGLHLRMESIDGTINFIRFEHIELTD